MEESRRNTESGVALLKPPPGRRGVDDTKTPPNASAPIAESRHEPATNGVARSHCLRNPRFDLVFIAGSAALALGTGLTVVLQPQWFPIVLMLDLWFLGYHHVIATFTRLTLDTESFKEHKFLVVALPWIILAATLSVAFTLGTWAIATTSLYWQWFHYTRQSYGIMRLYGRKAGEAVVRDTRWTIRAMYLVPLWGILHRSLQGAEKFLGTEVAYLPTHPYMVFGVEILALGAVSMWAFGQVRAWQERRFSLPLTLYMLSHFCIFYVGYIAIQHIDHGWLVLNVWHNVQYILVVWMYNNIRFKNGVDKNHWFLSLLSQEKVMNVIAYFAFTLLATTVVYGTINYTLRLDFLVAFPMAAIIIYQTVNFHHYVVDGLIWKLRKKKVRQTLGVVT